MLTLVLALLTGLVYSECDPACNSDAQEFCGTDSICHFYSCDNWYNYGNEKFTRYGDNQDVPKLQCTNIDDKDEYEYFGTSGILHGCNVSTALQQPFTRKCNVEFDDYTTFTCREMSFDTNFEFYTKKVNETNITCDDGKEPIYLYMSWLSFNTKYGTGRITSVVGSSSFNKTMASKTIYAALSSNDTFKETQDNSDPNANDDPNESCFIGLKISTFVFTFLLMTSFSFL